MTSKILISAATILLALNLSAAVERHALVIGNANYSSSPLRNPLNDARDMAAALKGLGFQVQSLLDADAGQMEQAIIDFSNRLNEGGVGLFYYAGHGVQARGRNYLIPLQANISSEIQLKHKTIDVGMVLDAMEYANNGVNIVILDACRDNPYGDSFRTNTRGLARMESPTGSLIAYATAPGDVAADGDGRNGLFTKHLLQAMQQPGRLVELTFKDVVKGVSRESGGRQTPFITASIADDFYFKPGSAPPPPPEPQPAPAIPSTSATIDGLSFADWLLVYGSNPITIASLDKVVAYERQHGGNAASRSYINKGIKVALANVNSADDLLEYQSKFGYLPGAPAQIEARLAELLAAGTSRQDLIRLRGQFPSSATLRLQLAGAYHQAKLFDAAAGEYQSWLGLTDSSHPERKQVLEALVAAREGRSLYKAGDIIQDCPECPRMVYIPAGSFRMGDIQGGGDSDEKPVHRVSVSAFLLGQTEVTVGQFRTFVKASGYKTEAEQEDRGCRTYENGSWDWRSGKNWRNPGFKQSAKEPVVCLSWNDTQRYIKWLSEKTGERYRLPSEAEWEYAARAGSETKYFFGNSTSDLCRSANGAAAETDFSWRNKDCRDGYKRTAPAASFTANAFGLYDMHGNVREWTQDCWNDSYKGAPSDGSAWLSGNCSRRVLRGGSWIDDPNYLRSANRSWGTTGYRSNGNGFRLARTLD